MKIHYTVCWNEERFELCNVRCSEEACFKQIVTDMTQMIISFDAVQSFASYTFDETLDSDVLMLYKNIPHYTI